MIGFSKDLLLRDTNELELGIERHCVALGLGCADTHQVRMFAHELLRDMEKLKREASEGDANARLKVEMFGMVMLLHELNIKAFGPEYVTRIELLSEEEPAWVELTRALWGELKGRSPDN